ncbi:helix-turn-helix transcriptional regulator [Halovivax limisalsi]|uniref:helix-turn-helix transcriptional regulator n=1 Tax=Halovivax limisalsi TaxID=1453760 RepID=UPI001FFCA617|nr:helix-turn-helix domain-containing protein [Halovivax limisalsi]
MTGENRNRLVTAVTGIWGSAVPLLASGSGPDTVARFPLSVPNRAVGLVPAGLPIVAVAVGIVVLIAVAVAAGRFVRRTDGQGGQPGAEQPILTDRERVLRLLDGNGGRMKQSQIVESVEWSKAKVSRLLAELESEEEIIKLRLGRENLICRPGYEPKASRSPRADGAKPTESARETTDEHLSDE